jgi:hypothetical protein
MAIKITPAQARTALTELLDTVTKRHRAMIERDAPKAKTLKVWSQIKALEYVLRNGRLGAVSKKKP